MIKRTPLLTTLLVGIVLASCGGSRNDPPRPSASAAPASPPGLVSLPEDSPKLALIRTAPVETALVPLENLSAPGKVEANANRLSKVVLPLTGRISSVLVKLGDYVRQGQPLLTLESADIDAAVSNFHQAQAALHQARSALAKAQMDLDREKDLFEHGAVPQKDVLNAQAVTVQAQAAVDQMTAASEQARSRLQLLGVSAASFGQRLTVHAPISGKVLELSAVNGEFRNDLSDRVITIADLSSVWVTSDVPETSIRFIRLGASLKVDLFAYPGETFRGRVTLIGDTVDPQTRTVKVRAELPNSDGRLKPEMFGNIQLAEQTEPKPTVPASAIIASEGKTLVWREAGKGRFQRTSVTTGVQIGDRVAILSGLTPSDRIVVDGIMLLTSN